MFVLDYPEGWILIADALLALPLSILVKLYKITYRV